MEKLNDNIELRSDKVRSIIGQIPPWIIRNRIAVILLVIAALFVGSYYFKYPYTITTTITFSKDESFVGTVKIPANEISRIEKGQEVEIYFDKVKNVNGLIFKSRLNEISEKLTVSNGSGFYTAIINKIENLNITSQTRGMAKITTDEMSFLNE